MAVSIGSDRSQWSDMIRPGCRLVADRLSMVLLLLTKNVEGCTAGTVRPFRVLEGDAAALAVARMGHAA